MNQCEIIIQAYEKLTRKVGYLDSFDIGDAEDLADKGVKGMPMDYIPSLKEHINLKPLFGLDYLSFKKGSFCFNNPKIPADDFVSLLMRCQEISSKSYAELTQTIAGDENRFHEVDPKKLANHGLITNGKIKLNGIERSVPSIYQFGLYTDNKARKAPRVAGYIGKWGIFYLLWFDWEHLIYPEVNKK